MGLTSQQEWDILRHNGIYSQEHDIWIYIYMYVCFWKWCCSAQMAITMGKMMMIHWVFGENYFRRSKEVIHWEFGGLSMGFLGAYLVEWHWQVCRWHETWPSICPWSAHFDGCVSREDIQSCLDCHSSVAYSHFVHICPWLRRWFGGLSDGAPVETAYGFSNVYGRSMGSCGPSSMGISNKKPIECLHRTTKCSVLQTGLRF